MPAHARQLFFGHSRSPLGLFLRILVRLLQLLDSSFVEASFFVGVEGFLVGEMPSSLDTIELAAAGKFVVVVYGCRTLVFDTRDVIEDLIDIPTPPFGVPRLLEAFLLGVQAFLRLRSAHADEMKSATSTVPSTASALCHVVEGRR
mmetsp:Transcript_9838/g.24989  ORF Transcript_9838/g.24989 Transcript_9838/m.24989 type:complete len:146 (-) Transcript_9838:53-490(-)